ncbi:class I SAM-dependent methyltransferase [Sorangium sp. So ce1128]|uniref:PRMT5 arginine-N-methyltransferase domain-containing protein n=1 Tax=Sorangium cellulosum TaxID=56 RepID=A0A3S5GY81_SORCE|nr:hypothetical protein [Sorangium cellulosum]
MATYRDLEIDGSTVKALVDTSSDAGLGSALWPSIGEYPIYDASLYQTLTDDEERNGRFRAALRRLAPGKVVLDIGTGQHLNWARESVQCGAAHALAIEEMEESYRNASQKLRSLGLEKAITLLHGSSASLEIEPKADVCVAEIIGSIAGAEGAAAILADARRRHLAPGGVIVPHRCVTQAAAVCLRDVLDRHEVAFSPEAIKYLEKIFTWNRAPFDVRLRIRKPAQSAILSNHAPVEILEFNGNLLIEQEARVILTIDRPGRIDGILTWLQISCLPDERPLDALRDVTSWASVYFPLFESEIPVDHGDTLDLVFRTALSDGGVHPDYALAATLRTRHGEHSAAHTSPHHGQTFREHAVYRALFSR